MAANLILNLSANSAELQKGLEQAQSKLNNFKKNTNDIGSQVTGAFLKLGVAIGGVAGAMEFAKKAMEGSHGAADKLAVVMGSANAISEKFFNNIANADFSNLIEGLTKAGKAGAVYAEAIDDIDARKLGMKLETANATPEQNRLQDIFRDNSGDYTAIERQDALNEYKRITLDLETKNLATAQVARKAEEDRLIGVGVEVKKVQELYTLYNGNTETIKSAVSKMAQLAELENKIKIAKGGKTSGGWGGLNQGGKTVTQLQDDYNKFYATITVDELKFADLVDANDKAKEASVVLMIDAMANEAKQKGVIAGIDLETLKIATKIGKLIKEERSDKQAIIDMANGKANPLPKANTSNLTIPTLSKPVELPNDLVQMDTAAVDAMVKKNAEIQKQIGLQEALEEVENRRLDIMYQMTDSMSQGAQSFKEYGQVIKSAIKDMVASLLAQSIANAIAKSMAFAKNPILGLALAGLASGAVLTLFNTIPGFADGTSFAPGGLSLVGERGPELVNLPRGSQVFSNRQSQSMMGGGEVVFKIEGTTLVGILNNQGRKINSYK